MAQSTIYPQAAISWDATGVFPSFAGSVPGISFDALPLVGFSAVPSVVTFEPPPVDDTAQFLTSDGEILTSDGEAISW